jgi:lysyl-tRNA synthetase class 2
MAVQWEPGASLANLKARAALLAQVREFMAARGVLEVETPLLCQHGVTDPHLHLFDCGGRHLQSSPEYAMKRLLAAGCGPIYQVCKAFRSGEAGGRHNPEFTLLEWYRPGFELHSLMDEVAALVCAVLGREGWRTYTYRELFAHFVALDPFAASDAELTAFVRKFVDVSFDRAPRDTWLDLILTHLIEPQLGPGLVLVHDYPASQAALAKLRQSDGDVVAQRFELYGDGVELANGYSELTDPIEQRARFEDDNRRLEAQGQPARNIDETLLAALEHGLPDCSGVALGLDRLLLLQLGASKLDEVLSFSWTRA